MYTILPFNFSRIEDEYLLVNPAGVHLFLSQEAFEKFVRHELPEDSDDFLGLQGNLFAAVGGLDLSVRQLAARYRTRMEFLRDFTALHMMVITLRCNQRCEYCQASCADEDAAKYDMSVETAERIVDFIFSSPIRRPKIEFQGGEPTLNWPAITATVAKAEALAEQQGKQVDFVICTNLLSITDEQLCYCKEHNIQISTSLDGPEHIHDKCRIARVGKNTYRHVIENIKRVRSLVGDDHVAALMTTSSYSLRHMREIVDEYVRQGMDGIFIRALNPYGFAAEQTDQLGYPVEDFVECYKDALSYILEINRKVFFPEYFTTLLLTRMLTFYSTGFVDLQSPSGAGISGAIYDYDGSVFPADEARMLARMGDRHFCLGNVHEDSWEKIFAGETQRKLTRDACVETTVPCAWCVFSQYCGTDPVRNYLETGSEVRNMSDSAFCRKNKAIFTHLFRLIRNTDDMTKDIIWSWITNNPGLVHREDD